MLIELFAVASAVAYFAAILLFYKFGGMNWTTDESLIGANRQLTANRLALNGEMHAAAAA